MSKVPACMSAENPHLLSPALQANSLPAEPSGKPVRASALI